ncbi:MAG TPA: DUF2946 domain-containing protein [Pseudomonas sp.]|uniref:DUF2946 family protein n=1 Tax=Stutzerimonas xanthomarina TaxID=271420 RepID=UPI000E8BB106|nr:DUF2946 family protein [Stutzerimonas xanthomarina]MBU0854458.1 DUF2946 family protein [Gammaproteobacteria bacterium]HAQ85416.1 DUF2946 domain-containing protein [Pseudomonas sp.]MBK3848187.1 DUF2946 domain-containing protein [Stutzerimonas xanthomarina]MBU1301266.1 DUF2946 family protein [Gammaproteobacteria bacterium]MBU1459665.1 DUF2946 family protein [Gammaproteobacteria bacterium]
MRRKGHFTADLWLGLFAMLMIHVGPLYSASQLEPAQSATAASVAHQHHHQAQGHAPKAHTTSGSVGQPAWLASLDLCGYCELLTLSPPLVLSFAPALPYFSPSFARLSAQPPLPAMPRLTGGYARAPPVLHG